MSFKLISHVIRGQRFFVYKINEVYYRHRLFCVLDKEYPFELIVKYKELSKSTEIAPFLGGLSPLQIGHVGFQFQEKTDLHKDYFFRYATTEECKFQINEVKKKKDIVEQMLTQLTETVTLEQTNKSVPRIEKVSQPQRTIGRFKI